MEHFRIGKLRKDCPNNFRTTPHIAHFFPVGMSVRAEVCEATRAHDVFFVVDENGERNVVYTDNKYVSKQVRIFSHDSHLFRRLDLGPSLKDVRTEVGLVQKQTVNVSDLG